MSLLDHLYTSQEECFSKLNYFFVAARFKNLVRRWALSQLWVWANTGGDSWALFHVSLPGTIYQGGPILLMVKIEAQHINPWFIGLYPLLATTIQVAILGVKRLGSILYPLVGGTATWGKVVMEKIENVLTSYLKCGKSTMTGPYNK